MSEESCSSCLFVTGFFRLAGCPQGLPMLLHVSEFLSFFMLSDIVFKNHISFIHSSVGGHSGCSHILVIVSNATVNTSCHQHNANLDSATFSSKTFGKPFHLGEPQFLHP